MFDNVFLASSGGASSAATASGAFFLGFPAILNQDPVFVPTPGGSASGIFFLGFPAVLNLEAPLPLTAGNLVNAIVETYNNGNLPAFYGKCYTRRAKPGEEPPQVMLSVKKGDWFYHSTDTKIRDYRCAFKVRSLTGQGAYEGARALAALFPDESHLEWNGGHTGPIYQTEWSDDVESKLGPKNTTVFTCQMSFCVRVIGVR